MKQGYAKAFVRHQNGGHIHEGTEFMRVEGEPVTMIALCTQVLDLDPESWYLFSVVQDGDTIVLHVADKAVAPIEQVRGMTMGQMFLEM